MFLLFLIHQMMKDLSKLSYHRFLIIFILTFGLFGIVFLFSGVFLRGLDIFKYNF